MCSNRVRGRAQRRCYSFYFAKDGKQGRSPYFVVSVDSIILFIFHFSPKLAANGLRAGEVFYFGLSAHLLVVKNIAIKLNKFLPKTILQYFYLQEVGAR
jgi:uncharacterized membrane protein YhaH (DUF805 family)